MAFTHGHALVIGTGTHLFHPLIDVPIAVQDAQAVSDVLVDPDLCGYPSEQVAFLHDNRATRSGILSALDDLATHTEPESTVFFFFCGHGTLGTDGNYHLVCHDTQLQQDRVLGQTGVSEAELIAKLRAIRARRTLLILNACYSGNISPSLSPETTALRATSPPEQAATALLTTGEGRILITACREEQVSYIGNGTLSIFTQALVEGLGGRGLQNNNGYVSAFGLYEYVYARVREEVRAQVRDRQEPELNIVKGVGPFAVSLYKGASTLGDFDAGDPPPREAAVREVAPAQIDMSVGQRNVDTGGGSYFEHVETGGGAFVGGGVDTGGGTFVGRDAQIGPANGEVTELFAALVQELRQSAPPERREEAVQKARALQEETAKGKQADDKVMASLLQDLVDLVPSAISTVASIFATPILAGLAGPVTQFVLNRLGQ